MNRDKPSKKIPHSYNYILWITEDTAYVYRFCSPDRLMYFDEGMWRDSEYIDLDELREDVMSHHQYLEVINVMC